MSADEDLLQFVFEVARWAIVIALASIFLSVGVAIRVGKLKAELKTEANTRAAGGEAK